MPKEVLLKEFALENVKHQSLDIIGFPQMIHSIFLNLKYLLIVFFEIKLLCVPVYTTDSITTSSNWRSIFGMSTGFSVNVYIKVKDLIFATGARTFLGARALI